MEVLRRDLARCGDPAALLLVRQLSEWILRDIWPGQRGAGAAILIGPPLAARPFEKAIAAPGGDYRVAGYVATERPEADSYLGTVEDLPSLIDQHEVEAVVVCADLPLTRISTVIEECLHAGCQILYPARAVRVYGGQAGHHSCDHFAFRHRKDRTRTRAGILHHR